MAQALKISCTIITKNEADRVASTLEPLKGLVDEILVVDSGSSDDTIKICERFGARVIHNDWVGFGPQKRFAEDQAEFDWILNLDADEVIKDDLIAEISALKASGNPQYSGYRFRQTSVYPGDEKPRPFADFHNFIRFYDKRAMRFHDSLVHDVVDRKGQNTGQLKGTCWHYSFRSIDHLVAKLDSYTTLQAKEIKRAKWKLRLRLLIEYPFQFFKYMISRRHITGGLFGLKLSHAMAKSKFQRIQKLLAA